MTCFLHRKSGRRSQDHQSLIVICSTHEYFCRDVFMIMHILGGEGAGLDAGRGIEF